LDAAGASLFEFDALSVFTVDSPGEVFSAFSLVALFSAVSDFSADGPFLAA
jgi:hypothetical protein